MKHWLIWLPIGLMLALVVMQTAYVWLYLRFLKRPLAAIDDPVFDGQPQVAVILCLRGGDPSLHRCLEGLWALDYPRYELHIVFDDQGDPAWPIVQRFLERRDGEIGPQVHRHVIHDRGAGRSLKCSAIITAILALDDNVDVVALVDADASVEPGWLKLLVDPLQDASVGASTGNRWFAPESGLGASVRKIWNAAALPQMCLYSIAWGGSLALRRETIERCQLLDRWSVAFCEDTLLNRQLADHDLKVTRVPELIVVNRETTSLGAALDWIGRQLLTVRLYHGRWLWVLLHAIVGALCVFGPPLVVLYFLIVYQWLAAASIAVVWAATQLLNLVLVQLIELGNWEAIGRGSRLNPSPGPDAGKAESAGTPDLNHRGSREVNLDVGLPCTSATGAIANFTLQLVYPFLAIAAFFRQRVSWRGIDYRIGRKARIEMLEYRRYADIASKESVGSEKSIH